MYVNVKCTSYIVQRLLYNDTMIQRRAMYKVRIQYVFDNLQYTTHNVRLYVVYYALLYHDISSCHVSTLYLHSTPRLRDKHDVPHCNWVKVLSVIEVTDPRSSGAEIVHRPPLSRFTAVIYRTSITIWYCVYK